MALFYQQGCIIPKQKDNLFANCPFAKKLLLAGALGLGLTTTRALRRTHSGATAMLAVTLITSGSATIALVSGS